MLGGRGGEGRGKVTRIMMIRRRRRKGKGEKTWGRGREGDDEKIGKTKSRNEGNSKWR